MRAIGLSLVLFRCSLGRSFTPARIGRMSVVHGGSKQDVTDAVTICVAAGGNCSLSLDWSPYIGESEREGRRVDPRRTTPGEITGIAKFREWAVNVTRWAAEASAALPGGFNISVGAIGFDQEQLCECGWTVPFSRMCSDLCGRCAQVGFVGPTHQTEHAMSQFLRRSRSKIICIMMQPRRVCQTLRLSGSIRVGTLLVPRIT